MKAVVYIHARQGSSMHEMRVKAAAHMHACQGSSIHTCIIAPYAQIRVGNHSTYMHIHVPAWSRILDHESMIKLLCVHIRIGVIARICTYMCNGSPHAYMRFKQQHTYMRVNAEAYIHACQGSSKHTCV